MRAALLITLAALTQPVGAAAEDTSGRYAVKGVGLMSCQQFSRGLAKQSDEAGRALSWMAGYLTAVNAGEDATFDIVSWQSEGMIAQALDARCKASPEEPLAKAVEAMVDIMRPDRINSEEAMVTVKVGTRQRPLYPSVIRRMQQKLVQRRAEVDVSGTFDAATERALRDFQNDAELAVTGFPDSVTLFRLLSAE